VTTIEFDDFVILGATHSLDLTLKKEATGWSGLFLPFRPVRYKDVNGREDPSDA
jgi:hypothetical protein